MSILLLQSVFFFLRRSVRRQSFYLFPLFLILSSEMEQMNKSPNISEIVFYSVPLLVALGDWLLKESESHCRDLSYITEVARAIRSVFGVKLTYSFSQLIPLLCFSR